MRILLPPSETKRDGGDPGAPLDLSRLSFPMLTPEREKTVRAVTALSRDPIAMSAALRLGPSQRHELVRNETLTRSPTMPALARYTGVLYDGVAIDSLDAGAREFAANSVVIHSALFGLLGAGDPIPAYRVSHDSRLPDIRLGPLWRTPVSSELARLEEVLIDLRSESYAALGPIPVGAGRAVTVRVVAETADGTVRALNHFNKRGKGEFVRALVTAGLDHRDVDSLLEWALGSGIRLAPGRDGVLELTVDQVLASRR